MFNQKEYIEQWRKDNPEKVRKHHKRYYQINSEKIKERSKQYKENNPERIREIQRETHKRWRSKKYKTNLKFNLSCRMGKAIYKSLKISKNGKKWQTLVGYTLNDLIKQLEITMPKDYNWWDYLNGRLHFDHIIPIRAFKFKTPEDKEFKQCWSLYNLRLLTAKENRLKRDTINNPILLGLLINN